MPRKKHIPEAQDHHETSAQSEPFASYDQIMRATIEFYWTTLLLAMKSPESSTVMALQRTAAAMKTVQQTLENLIATQGDEKKKKTKRMIEKDIVPLVETIIGLKDESAHEN
jgi:hypothetical protein